MMRTLIPLVLGAVLGAVVVDIVAGSRLTSALMDGAKLPTAATNDTPGTGGPDTAITNPTIDRAPTDSAESDPLRDQTAADPEALLDELSDIESPARRRELALAALAALGNDDAAVARVAAMLPEAERMAFRIDALQARAESDPFAALQSALALDIGDARRLAVAKIAAVAASLDPSSAVADAFAIRDRELKTLYLANIAGAWAEQDAEAALAWLRTAVPAELSADAAAGALEAIAATDPEGLLARADSLGPALQSGARRAAILALADRDTAAALEAVDALNPSRARSDLAVAVAERYALDDPEAAIEWAKSRPDSVLVLEGALRGAAAVDYDRAVDLAIELMATEPITPVFALIESGAGDFGRFADRLLAADFADQTQKLQQMMIRWPQVDADAALEWSLANADELEANMLMLLTQESGRENPAAAMAALDEMPPWLQKDWLAGVAKGVAMADPDRAQAFLEQHYGEPGYDEGLAGVVDSLAGADPVAAADLVERTGAQAAGRVGWIWAQQDPDAAASWVANLEDPSMRRDGVTNLAANWARTDPDAAVGWLRDMPAGAPRDFGLEFALPSLVAAEGELDPSLLDAIGDEVIRERALVSSIATLARTDADEARRLADSLIDDPVLLEQARQRIAQQSGGTDITSIIISSSIDVPH